MYVDPEGRNAILVAALVGAAVGGLIDLGIQLIMNGGDFSCVNYWQVGASAGLGAFGGPVAGLGGRATGIGLSGRASGLSSGPLAAGSNAAKGPRPNGGRGPQHGGPEHNDAIDNLVNDLLSDPSVSNIRKNQQQVDVNGKKVGRNRPDVQYDKDGCHTCVEFDHSARRSLQHGDKIRRNDPKAKVDLRRLK